MKTRLRPFYILLCGGVLALAVGSCALFDKMFGVEIIEEFTPDNEYYTGRGVSAAIIDQFKCADLDSPRVKQHLNYLNAMAGYIYTASRVVDRNNLGKHVKRDDKDRERKQNLVIQNGITVGLLDTKEVVAFACPGGFMWISYGALELCRDEDELAAIICHEMGHLVMNHGMDAYREEINAEARRVGYTQGIAKVLAGDGTSAELIKMFGNVIGGYVTKLHNNGYGEDQEMEADNFAVRALAASGYDPNALLRMFERIRDYQKANPVAGKYLEKHPPVEKRMKAVQKLLKDDKNGITIPNFNAGRQARVERFKSAISG